MTQMTETKIMVAKRILEHLVAQIGDVSIRQPLEHRIHKLITDIDAEHQKMDAPPIPARPMYSNPDWAQPAHVRKTAAKLAEANGRRRKLLAFSLGDLKCQEMINEENRQADLKPQDKQAVLRLTDDQLRRTTQAFATSSYLTSVLIREIRPVLNSTCHIVTHIVGQIENSQFDIIVEQANAYDHLIAIGDIVSMRSFPGKATEILSVVERKGRKGYTIRRNCPVCGHRTLECNMQRNRCINPACYGVMLSTIGLVCSKEGFPNLPFSHKVLHHLLHLGYIRTMPDLFQLTDRSFAEFQKKLPAEDPGRLIDPTMTIICLGLSAKKMTLANLIYCLNLPAVRWLTAKKLAQQVRNIERLKRIHPDDIFSTAKGNATFISQTLRRPAMQKLLTDYIAAQVNPTTT